MKKHLNGVMVPHHKGTADKPTVRMPAPEQVTILMQQQLGPECTPLVKAGEEVKVGQKIAFGDHPMNVPIHAPVSGKIKSIGEMVTPQGAKTPAIVIESDGEMQLDESLQPPQVTDRESFLAAVRESGLVGLGGASFPTFIKLNPRNVDEVDTLVVNAAECEPYITADNRGMLERSDDLLAGIAAVVKYLQLSQVVIGIEDNKPGAIELLKQKEDGVIRVQPLRSRYPQGAEKVIVYETTGRVMAEGKLPADIGVLVMNVSSLIFLGAYLRTGVPLIEKYVTVAGSAITNPQNVIVPIGTSVADLVEFCGGFAKEPGEIIMGGPMMGVDLADTAFPVIKNTNAIVALTPAEVAAGEEKPCINCGCCIFFCPFNLMPTNIDRALQANDVDRMKALKVNLCMECGSCAYICPANRQLVLSNKLAKRKVANAERRAKA